MVVLPLFLREVVHEVRVPAEYDVSSTTGHVGGYGHGSGAARLGDDERLALVLLGVEDGVLDLPPVEHLTDDFRLGDIRRADQDGLASLVAGLDLVDDRLVLGLLSLIDEVGVVVADHQDVRRNLDNVELVDLPELLGLGDRGTGHARELLVEAEVVLQGDRGVGNRLTLDGDALLGFEGLVEAVGKAASGRHAPSELVDDDDLAVFDHVLAVALVDGMGLEGVLGEVDEPEVLRRVHVLDAKHLFQLRHAFGG